MIAAAAIGAAPAVATGASATLAHAAKAGTKPSAADSTRRPEPTPVDTSLAWREAPCARRETQSARCDLWHASPAAPLATRAAAAPGRLVLLAIADVRAVPVAASHDSSRAKPDSAAAAMSREDSAVARRIVLVDSVSVTATRGAPRLATPGGTTTVPARDLMAGATGAVDDALRATPGFSLFRRSSSAASNPTTQGVTLRGLSASGAGRTLVLADGAPLNDPFGSWVLWDRVPLAAIERVELVRGAAGDLYGADALGGVVQVLTFDATDPMAPRLRAIVDGASRSTGRASGYAAGARGPWSGALSGEWQKNAGYVSAAPEARGAVDVPGSLTYGNGLGEAGWSSGGTRVRVRANAWSEDRGNGTPLQVNDTRGREGRAEAAGTLAGGAWSARASGGTQTYDQTFSAVAPDHASERLTAEQRVPSRFGVADAQWTRGFGTAALAVGGDGSVTRATVNETRYPSGAAVPSPESGGKETTLGAYARLRVPAGSRLVLVFGARGDRWVSRPLDGALPMHEATTFSPRVSAWLPLSGAFALEAAAYRAWRTPTLNELYRGFRAGNVVTNPNPSLDPERLTGVEGGVLVTGDIASARLTAFHGRLEDAVANVTVSSTPSLIVRERRNAQELRSSGAEFEIEVRPAPAWRVSGVAVVTHSVFASAPDDPQLVGQRVSQVPEWQLGVVLERDTPRTLAARLEARGVGEQFDDDLNQFRLAPFGILNVTLRRTLGMGAEAFLAGDNLLNAEYDVGMTPTRTIGAPRTVRAGVTLSLE